MRRSRAVSGVVLAFALLDPAVTAYAEQGALLHLVQHILLAAVGILIASGLHQESGGQKAPQRA